jgi:hypothetical protein
VHEYLDSDGNDTDFDSVELMVGGGGRGREEGAGA